MKTEEEIKSKVVNLEKIITNGVFNSMLEFQLQAEQYKTLKWVLDED